MLICWDDEHDGDADAPFRATMFHAVGLNAMAATEISKDCLEKSMRVDSELVMVGVVRVVENVEEVCQVASEQQNHAPRQNASRERLMREW